MALVVHPPCQEDVISGLNLLGDFDDCQRQADCGLYHRQDSHDHHFGGLHLCDWFWCGHGEVHLPPFRYPQHIPPLLVVQSCLVALRVDMIRVHSTAG
jgi:hypothetical protein